MQSVNIEDRFDFAKFSRYYRKVVIFDLQLERANIECGVDDAEAITKSTTNVKN